MNVKKYFGLMLLLLSVFLNAALVDISEINELTSTTTLKMTGAIQNIQVAPFNSNLISFELKDDNEAVSLYLYNRAKKRVIKIESQNILNAKKKVSKSIDEHLYWHPSDRWFVFYGNAGNKDNIYICRLADEDLNNKYAVKGFLMTFDESEFGENDKTGKPFKARYKDPAFSSDGDIVYFVRKLIKKGENYVLCKTSNTEQAKENKYENLKYEVVLQKNFDIENPIPSPKLGSDAVAFLELKNRPSKKDDDFYLKYLINVVNADSKEEAEVSACEGFKSYSYFWDPKGDYLYYYRAVPRIKTPQDVLNENDNILNLYAAKINQVGNKIFSIPQSNQQTDVILADVRDRGLAILDETNLLIPVLRDFHSLVAVNLDKWRNRDAKYYEQLDLTYPSYYPRSVKNEFFFVNYKDGGSENYIDMLSVGKVKLNFPSGSVSSTQAVADNKPKNVEVKKPVTEKPQTKPVVEKPVEKVVEPVAVKKVEVPAASNVPITERVAALLKENNQLAMLDFIKMLEIPVADKARMAELQNALLEVAEIKTVNNKRLFVLKSSASAVAGNTPESNNELQAKSTELEKLKKSLDLVSQDLSKAKKEKDNESQLLADMKAEITGKKAENVEHDLRIKNIREAGSNQLANLQNELKSSREKQQSILDELTKNYDEITNGQKNLTDFAASINSLKTQIPVLEAKIAALNSDKNAARDKALREEKKALEEAARAAEEQAKAEEEAKEKAAQDAYTKEKDEYEDEEDEYSEYADEDEETEVSEPVAPPPTAPKTIKKRR